MASTNLQSSSKNPNRLGRAVRGAWRRLSPSRAVSQSKIEENGHSAPTIQDSKGSIGLNLLHNPPDPKIDFIFVHGLGGGSQKTWSYSADPQHYWPKAWLSEDAEFASIRIHSYGYDADWNKCRESSMNILDFARGLLCAMDTLDIRRSHTKIVLIGHSMGGIVLKQAYMLAREDDQFKDFRNRIHTLYFLATPHRGSDSSALLANILAISYGKKQFVDELRDNSPTIHLINDSFRRFADGVQLWSFYETYPTNIFGMQILIVDKTSATLGFKHENCGPLSADHRHVCKFQSIDDPNYKTLRGSFIRTIDMISLEDSISSSRATKLELDQLDQLTAISVTPEVDLSKIEGTRVPGSCEWLVNKQTYLSWQEAQTGSPKVFWLSGKAGSGKSVLSSRVIAELQANNLRCSYFFFKKGQTSSILTCLGSLANQMGRVDASILRSLLNMPQNALAWETWDDKTLWRKIFLGCIFKGSKSQNHFWVIDAVDECQKSQLFLNLLKDAPPWLRIFFTSRNDFGNEEQIANKSGFVEHYQMQNEDTLGDFKIFIDYRLEHASARNDSSREEFKQKILEKAFGSFLWVSLVIERLEQVYSEEQAEEVLNEVPKEVDELYGEMLENVLQNRRAVGLARSLYMWTLFSLRPLDIDGLQSALKLDMNQTVHNLEKLVPAISGRLVSVNQNHEAEVIHETAKSYLLQQDKYPELALPKAQCHTRIAQICLGILGGKFTKIQQSQTVKRPSVTSLSSISPDLADYAVEYFSDHLQRSFSEDNDNWDLLCKFLDCNLLDWIEFLAKKRCLRSVTRTALNLRAYFTRRVKYLSPISPQKASMESWIYDMLRLSAKFGMSLNISPSSIHHLIPSMCPSESMISKYLPPYTSETRFKIKGLTYKSWDDCLARIDFPAVQTSAIACGEQYSAVALSNGSIRLYFQDSVQTRSILKHGGRANVLAFSNEDQYLASSGQRKVNLWNPAEGALLWTVDTSHQTIAMSFMENERFLSIATLGNCILNWDLEDGKEIGRWLWTDSVRGPTDTKRAWPQPSKAVFSSKSPFLAVSYRGLPLHLFETTTQKFLGTFSRDSDTLLNETVNHYIIEALAFNPSAEINILIASYGDGELVIYDIDSRQLRYRMTDVFAHCLKCSPDGRSLITGSSRGTLQIYEFAGASGDRLLPLYKINAHDDGIRDIAFSSDSLRFADIRGSQYRVWEPAVLACNDMDEDSQSELSHAVIIETRSVGMLEGPPDPEITAICCHPNGSFVFCGKKDGSVSYFDTSTATQKKVLYRHASNIGISCILFIETGHLLVTADESGRVLVNKIVVSEAEFEFASCVTDIRSEHTLSSLLHDGSGIKILLRGKDCTEIRTTEGQKIGTSLFDVGGEAIFSNHPSKPDHFISIDRQGVKIFSWADGLEAEALLDEKKVNVMVTPPTPTIHRVSLEKTLGSCEESWTGPFVACLFKQNSHFSPRGSNNLGIWPASSLSTSSSLNPCLPLGSLAHHTNCIRQIIAMADTTLFFLDTDLWICSLDVSTLSTISAGARRHFFLLSEWQSIYGGFIVEYIPVTREFVVAKKHELLVISRGLEFEEPWVSSADVS